MKHTAVRAGCVLFMIAAAQLSDAQAYSNICGPGNILKYYSGPYLGDRIMSFNYISRFDVQDLPYLIGDISAKYGRPFENLDMRRYFENTSWYIENPRYTDAMLTRADRENIVRIAALQSRPTQAESVIFAKVKAGKVLSTGPTTARIVGSVLTLSLANLQVSFDAAAGSLRCIVTPASRTRDSLSPLGGFLAGDSTGGENGRRLWLIFNGRLYLIARIQTGMWGNSLEISSLSCAIEAATGALSDVEVDMSRPEGGR